MRHRAVPADHVDNFAATRAGSLRARPVTSADRVLPYRPDIDGMRAVAVLGVVFYHAYPALVPGGFAGVDIFFVISGYLISGLIFKQFGAGGFSFPQFYAHRIRRIFPALALVLVATFPLGWYLLAPGDFVDYAHSLLGGVGFYANFTDIKENYFQALGADSLLLHLWSLGIEEQFYLVWPLLIWSVWRWAPRILPVTIAVLIVASFADNLLRADAFPIRAFYYPDARLWELAIGGGLAFATSRNAKLFVHWGYLFAGVGAAMLLAGLFLLNGNFAWPGWWALLPTIGTACVLAAGPDVWMNKRILASRLPVAIGKISYPWYLWHWPLLLAGRMAAWSLPQIWIDSLSVLTSLGLATATYFWVERPIRFGKRRRINTIGPVVAMVVPAILAGIILAGHGFADRFPEDLRIILAARDRSRSEDRQFGYLKCFDATLSVTRLNPGECVDAKNSPSDRRPLVFLWGDSHAMSLYAGLRDVQQQRKDFRLAVFAKGSCPFFAVPGKTWSAHGCTEFNNQVREQIRRLKPDILLVDAFWADPQYFGGSAIDADVIHSALLSLQAERIPRMVVVGTVPIWLAPQPTIIAREWRYDLGVIPDYTKRGLNVSTYAAEASVRKAVGGTRAIYIPLLDKLCTAQGCLLMADRKNHDPLQLDGWHLTPAGSRLVAHLIIGDILGTRK